MTDLEFAVCKNREHVDKVFGRRFRYRIPREAFVRKRTQIWRKEENGEKAHFESFQFFNRSFARG